MKSLFCITEINYIKKTKKHLKSFERQCVYIYACVCIYIYMHTYIHTHTLHTFYIYIYCIYK